MLKGVLLKVGATFVFAVMSAFIKVAGARFPVGEVVLFRSAFAMLVLAAWLHSRGEFPAALKTRRPLGHIGRSLAGTGGMYSNFIALALLPLADATAFTFVTPLLVVPLAAFWLGEAVAIYRWGAVATGFAGVLVMLSDHLGADTGGRGVGASIALIGALFSAVAMIQTRRLTRSEATGAIVFYFSTVTAVVAALTLLSAEFGLFASQRFVAPDVREAAMLAAIGIFGGVGQILMTHSYRYADASIIAAFDYVAMIWAAGIGYFAFAEPPTTRVLLGAAVVAAAGVYVVWRARRVGRVHAALTLLDKG